MKISISIAGFDPTLILGFQDELIKRIQNEFGVTVSMRNEHIYLTRPPISADTTMNVKNMPADQIDVMNKISVLMADVDANFNELQLLYNGNKQLQFPNP